ncbi:hypothetical protein GTO27_05200 [Candidatus Bathyarchaeota archaeon]|nr:hypothetical protein [Candidatus Bathyarchaeota archaeon]
MAKKRVPSPHIYPLPSAPFIDFWADLPENCELREIVNEALDTLKGRSRKAVFLAEKMHTETT